METQISQNTACRGTAFKAYLWGMETRFRICRDCYRWCLKPTYEEWKQNMDSAFIVPVKCLKPTYEEWKQIFT